MAAGEIYSATLWCILDKVCKKTIDPGIIFKLLPYNLEYVSMIICVFNILVLRDNRHQPRSNLVNRSDYVCHRSRYE